MNNTEAMKAERFQKMSAEKANAAYGWFCAHALYVFLFTEKYWVMEFYYSK